MATARKLPAIVSSIERHAPGVYTLLMRPSQERGAPRFRAGQFLHLALDSYDPSSRWPESRVFSIANSPTRRDEIRVTYSVVGRYTERMERELAVGAEVWLKFPYGSFFLETAAGRETVLVAGGTGVTPFISFLEEAHDKGPETFDAPIRLFYGARSAELLSYRDKIEACRANLSDKFTPFYFIEQADDGDEGFLTGTLDIERIRERLDAPERALWYLSGPLAMIRAFRAALAERGVGDLNIRVDDWE